MPQKHIELSAQAKEANYKDVFRRGNVVFLPEEGSVVVTGDIHGHRRNFERIVTFANLDNHPERHVVLQEIIHGGAADEFGGCLSYKLLFDALRYKLEFPDRVHLIMSNHDTAFICDADVMKDGKEMNRLMRMALDRRFGAASREVKAAIAEYLLSQPLAVRCPNGVWISHSLPSDRFAEKFDRGIFEREIGITDCRRPGDVYLLTWGRNHSPENLRKLAAELDVDIFILGHQEQEDGCGLGGENVMIVNCEHNHGCIVEIDLSKTYNVAELLEAALPLASIS